MSANHLALTAVRIGFLAAARFVLSHLCLLELGLDPAVNSSPHFTIGSIFATAIRQLQAALAYTAVAEQVIVGVHHG